MKQMRRTAHEPESERRRFPAIIALLLLTPVPTIGVYVAMWHEATAGTTLGQGIYAASKLWIVLLPAMWLLMVERGRMSWSPPRHGGFVFGIVSGIVISLIIVSAWLFMGETLIERDVAREAAARSGLDSPARYLLLAVYLCTVNALIEEYVWRWFCYRQCERLTQAWRGGAAVVLSAAFFTVHHIVALAAQFGTLVVVLGSLGVFIGGCTWSYCYRRYRSVWPGFVSHAIVDVAIFVIGWQILFGST